MKGNEKYGLSKGYHHDNDDGNTVQNNFWVLTRRNGDAVPFAYFFGFWY